LVAVKTGLDLHGLNHAFGGAIALAFHVREPRATSDIDVNVTTDPADPVRAFRALPPQVQWGDDDVARCRADGQVRLFWVEEPFPTPVDVFLPQHVLHAEVDREAETVDLLGERVRILSATHLAVFKALFNRTKDWADIEAMLEFGQVDLPRVVTWLTDLVGGDDPRIGRLAEAERTVARQAGGDVALDAAQLLRRASRPVQAARPPVDRL
jgi:hypothetical protein